MHSHLTERVPVLRGCGHTEDMPRVFAEREGGTYGESCCHACFKRNKASAALARDTTAPLTLAARECGATGQEHGINWTWWTFADEAGAAAFVAWADANGYDHRGVTEDASVTQGEYGRWAVRAR